MTARRYEELFAWQLADAFKKEVFGILRRSEAARRDLKYRGQLVDSASAVAKDLAEGFRRKSPGDLMRFIDYAVGSLAEAKERLKDGTQLEYFPAEWCRDALRFAKRCDSASLSLKESQRVYLEQQQAEARRKRRRRADSAPKRRNNPRPAS